MELNTYVQAGTSRMNHIFFLYFSGHGGQTPDKNGDEADGLDETWCLYNGELIDDELYDQWRKFKKGVRILVLSDSCHSGTILKFQDLTSPAQARLDQITELFSFSKGVKAMPPKVAIDTYKQNAAFYDAIQAKTPPQGNPPLQASVQLISACKESELCSDGQPNSVFTDAVKRVWHGGQFSGSYISFADQVRMSAKRANPFQTAQRMLIDLPNPAFESQRPFTIVPPK
jgi:hypothetical protein